MSEPTDVTGATSRVGRFAAWGVAAVTVALAIAWLIRTRSTENQSPPTATGGEAMPGMDMSGGGAAGDGSISLTAEQLREFGITFGEVEVRTLTDVVRTVGVLGLDETRISAVTVRFGGYVERLLVDFTGRSVREGEPLVEVYSPELLAAQEELLLAARLQEQISGSVLPGVQPSSADLVDAARQRLLLWGISEDQIDQILADGQARRTLTLYAPASGVVIEKNVLVGQSVVAGQSLYTIADLTELWVDAEVREADAGLVHEGDAVSVEMSALPGRLIPGRIEYVYPTLADQARTLRARVAIANPGGRLRPGMYATVRIQAAGRSALTVPASAVLDTGERRLVFVDMGGGRILPQEVEVGRISGELAEVIAGLEPGQRVVTSPQFLLDSESNLAEVMRSMIGQTTNMGATDLQGGDMQGMTMPPTER
ncbi:MAG: efflux RND transporter periplasmic adaptor subunit [Longimicrobiales bacterium]